MGVMVRIAHLVCSACMHVQWTPLENIVLAFTEVPLLGVVLYTNCLPYCYYYKRVLILANLYTKLSMC